MDAASLRELQAPLKARYREQPDAAHVRLHAEGSVDADAIACRLDTGRALVEAGLHPATGGSGLQPARAICCWRPLLRVPASRSQPSPLLLGWICGVASCAPRETWIFVGHLAWTRMCQWVFSASG